jgi:Bacteriophage HK97-gp10, putative tail-component
MADIRIDVDAARAVAMIDRAVRACSPPMITAAVGDGADVFGAGARRRAPKRSGRLTGSIKKKQTGPYSFEIATDLVYAQITEFGGTIRPKTKKVLKFGDGTFSKRARIPAQPYMIPTFNEDSDAAFTAVADAFEQAL